MAAIEVVGVRDREIRERTLVLGEGGEAFRIGSALIQPDELLVVWTRERIASAGFRSKAGWRMVSLKVAGPRRVGGAVRHEERREFRFERPEDAPRWMTSLANRHIPAEEFGEE